KRGLALMAAVMLCGPSLAMAHVGSPDVFYDGLVGPYPARVTVRMPGVVPGRAEISVRVQTTEPVQVSFLPLYSRTVVTNAPAADIGHFRSEERRVGKEWGVGDRAAVEER